MKRERGHRYNASGQRYIVRLYEMNRKKTKNQEKLAFWVNYDESKKKKGIPTGFNRAKK